MLFRSYKIHQKQIPFEVKSEFVKKEGNEILLLKKVMEKQNQAQQKRKAAHQKKPAAHQKQQELKQQKAKQDARSKNNSTNVFPRSLLHQINIGKTNLKRANLSDKNQKSDKADSSLSDALLKKILETRREYVRTDDSVDDSDGNEWEE